MSAARREAAAKVRRVERNFALNLAHLIDETTPYRDGQIPLIERALWVRPGWHLAFAYAAGVLAALTWLYTR